MASTLPIPSLSNVLLDAFIPRYRSHGSWSLPQLGATLAAAQVHWWSTGEVEVTSTAAHGRLGIEGGSGPDPVLNSDHDDSVNLNRLLQQLLTAVRVRGIDLNSTYDAKRGAYVLTRPVQVVARGEEGSAGQKRRREEDTTLASGSTSTEPLLRPRVASRSSVPRVTGSAVYTTLALQPHGRIQALFASGMVTSASGVTRKLRSAVGPYEGYHLHRLVLDNAFTRTLEVGVANAMSTLYITSALEALGGEGVHTGIDPSSPASGTMRAACRSRPQG